MKVFQPFRLNTVNHSLARGGTCAAHTKSFRCPALPGQTVTRGETLQQMIELQFELLSTPEQRILKSASVVGERFSVWTSSSTLELDPEQIENCCEQLVGKKTIHSVGGDS